MLWSLQNILSPFFSACEQLLFIQIQCLIGFIISGSMALSFFMEIIFEEADLDLYIEFGRRIPVFEFMLQAGYIYMPRLKQNPSLEDIIDKGDMTIMNPPKVTFSSAGDYKGQTIIAMLDFVCPGSERKVQIMLTRGTPIYCVLQFHSTCVMNFIMSTHAYSLYPLATLQRKFAVNSFFTKRLIGDHLAIVKYKEHGFTYIPTGEDYEVMFQPYKCRRVGDKFTLTVSLNMEKEEDGDLFHPEMANMW
ncbi:uncharacterized protein EV420DRAFT_1273623 [Desarmillaria tabescens]|uniref:Uncharacterized protein n=1 Tax=Armillaria tabescens TaxID=1929756 RepID=A0AA39K3J3_ARMTA|nr:uncharacterized protein EV420DRAFT_1273623 [Desarmillaria tabescens]KAK0452790.1 hypothetical protein EV420DRAFT_1273623 [Desarmillaria tabescens]